MAILRPANLVYILAQEEGEKDLIVKKFKEEDGEEDEEEE